MVLVMNDDQVNNREAYLPLAKAFVEDAKKDKGCIDMNIYVDPEDEGRVVYVSHWESKEDFLAHMQGPAFAKHIPGMGQYFISAKDTILSQVTE